MAKQTVRFTRLNWDVEFLKDIFSNNGFVISEPATFSVDETKTKSLYGARSILYGTNYEDETSFIERYRCECGEFTGKMFEGEICPKCQKKVTFRDANIKYTGWITLGDNYIINPYYYNRLCDCLGKQVFPEIIRGRRQVDVNGNVSIPNFEEYGEKPKSPFAGIGTEEFRVRFEEIMNYFKKKKKKKEDEIDSIIQESSSVFCSHIPIYSTLLRPQSSTEDSYYFNTIDKLVNPLFKLSEKIKTAETIDKIFISNRIQQRVNDLWEENFNLLNGKEGLIRGQILGGSLNYTSRNVICPNPTLHDDEVDLSYHTFRELFKFQIIRTLMDFDDISLSKAYGIWNHSYKFDKRVYEVMQYLVKTKNPRIIMNRNPTLNYYSMLLMRVRKVKPDITDFCLSVPLSVLPGLNADFDGDILNIIGLMNDELIYAFRKFDPVSRMIISRDSGLLNEYFGITKTQLIDLYYFCTV